MSPIVAFLVNGGPNSAMGIRARSFATHLAHEFDVRLAYRSNGKVRSTIEFVQFVKAVSPAAVYVFDMAAAGVLAALAYKAVTGTPVIIDTGDVISALGTALGRGRIGAGLTVALEQLSLKGADHLVVRGTNHRRLLNEQGYENVTVVQDGVDLQQFRQTSAGNDVRSALGINGDLVLGTLGTSNWNEGQQTCYGWDMLDVLDRLRDYPVQALMIGNGSGIDRMRDRARALGLDNRIHFLGFVPYEELPSYLNAMDVCLSKQTNDLVGQVRTTGKLPLYMACARYILATRVGEAEYVLPDPMLIPFEGVNDPTYVDHLVDRLQALLLQRSELQLGRANRDRALKEFDYTILSRRLSRLLHQFV